ncbi:MAG: prepilin-type N-terminal cleavage/methylation domain-containing protein [Haloferula sp.]
MIKRFPGNNQVLRRNGFTLVELMVVITIIVVLVSLSFAGYRRLKSNASAMVDANDMRTIHTAIHMYAEDNNGFLPVTWAGVSPVYRPNAKDLTTALAPYLGANNPKSGHFFKEMASENFQKEANDNHGPSMLVMHDVYSGKGRVKNPGRPSPMFQPFGYPNPYRAPMRLSAAVSKMGNPAMRLLITENDQAQPNYARAKPGWYDKLPEGMAHGSYRLGLYWDGHVGKLDINLLPK